MFATLLFFAELGPTGAAAVNKRTYHRAPLPYGCDLARIEATELHTVVELLVVLELPRPARKHTEPLVSVRSARNGTDESTPTHWR
jgi:hypothetical protein